MNMILHGINNADLANDDTLAAPQHRTNGELLQFDQVLTNPPFSQNYEQRAWSTRSDSRYGLAPETGKKADLMFAQHMLAVLKPDGIGATVMPHGVLFRGGAERDIRKGIIEDDRLEAVIGLAPNLFYGTGIPACILVLRGTGPRRAERQRKVLFINADREFTAGRAQNHLARSTPRRSSPPTATSRTSPASPASWTSTSCGERLQPQHPPLRRQHPAARAPGRPRPPARRRPGAEVAAHAAPFSAYGIDVWSLFALRPPRRPGYCVPRRWLAAAPPRDPGDGRRERGRSSSRRSTTGGTARQAHHRAAGHGRAPSCWPARDLLTSFEHPWSRSASWTAISSPA